MKNLDPSNFADVGRFHEKFGLPSVPPSGPQEVTPETLIFRAEFILEELQEYLEAMGLYLVDGAIRVDPAGGKPDLLKAFDALLDIVYVVMGTAHLQGFPWQEGWDIVQAANMNKVRAKPDGSDSLRGSALDVVKPEGWLPPDGPMALLLQLKGFILEQEYYQ